jgi:hypothetical protein
MTFISAHVRVRGATLKWACFIRSVANFLQTKATAKWAYFHFVEIRKEG